MLMPDLAPAHFNRADILLRLGRNAQALASYDQAIALQPKFADAYANRGSVLKAMGRDAEARASFERAAALDPTFQKLLEKD